MPAPTLVAATGTGSGMTAYTVNKPAGGQAGDYYIVWLTVSDVNLPQSGFAISGFTTEAGAQGVNGVVHQWFWKAYSGTEGSTFTVTGVSNWCGSFCFLVRGLPAGWVPNIAPPDARIAGSGPLNVAARAYDANTLMLAAYKDQNESRPGGIPVGWIEVLYLAQDSWQQTFTTAGTDGPYTIGPSSNNPHMLSRLFATAAAAASGPTMVAVTNAGGGGTTSVPKPAGGQTGDHYIILVQHPDRTSTPPTFASAGFTAVGSPVGFNESGNGAYWWGQALVKAHDGSEGSSFAVSDMISWAYIDCALVRGGGNFVQSATYGNGPSGGFHDVPGVTMPAAGLAIISAMSQNSGSYSAAGWTLDTTGTFNAAPVLHKDVASGATGTVRISESGAGRMGSFMVGVSAGGGGSTTPVSTSRATTWNTSAGVTTTRATTWNVAAAVAAPAVRTFDGSSRINTATPAISGMTYGSVVAIARVTGTGGDGYHNMVDMWYSGSGSSAIQLGITDSGSIFAYFGAPGWAEIPMSVSAAEGWCLFAASKASGSQPINFWKYVFSTGVWTTVASSPQANADRQLDTASIGGYTYSEYWMGDIAGLGVWKNVALTDTQVRTLAANYNNWLALSPTSLWLLDQAATTTAVTDLTGNGANQTSLTGTTVTLNASPMPPFVIGGTTPVSTSRSTTWNVAAPVVYSDDFNRANGALGSPWVTVDAALAISGNKLSYSTNGAVQSACYDMPLANDQWAEADLTIFSGAYNSLGPMIRMGTAALSDAYYLWYDTTAGFQVWKRVGGTYSQVGTSIATAEGTYKMRLEAEGTTIRVFKDGTQVLSTTDTSIASGKTGMLGDHDASKAATADNFRASALPYVSGVSSDTFTYSDGVLATVGSTNWQNTAAGTQFAPAKVVSNRVINSSVNMREAAVWKYPVIGKQEVYFDRRENTTTNNACASALMRWDAATSSGYELSLNYLALYRWDNGVRSYIADTFGPVGVVNTWETYAFIADTDGTLTIKNAAGTTILTNTDTTYTANTGVGIMTVGSWGDAWGEIDNWHVGTYVPGGSTTPVTATRATTWVTKAAVTTTRATTWNVAVTGGTGFPFYDDFNRANGAPGANYVTLDGSFVIDTNMLRGNSSNWGFGQIAGTPPSADQYVEATVFYSGSGFGGNDFYLRQSGTLANNSTSVVMWWYFETGVRQLGCAFNVAGVDQGGGSTQNITPTAGTTFTCRLEVQGTAWRLYYNGSLLDSGTQTAVTGVGNFALDSYDGGRLDAIGVGAVGAPTTSVSTSRSTLWNVEPLLWKGVGANTDDPNVAADLALIDASWMYDWTNAWWGVGDSRYNIPDVQYVPMMWGDWITDTSLGAGPQAGTKILLGFNEPNYPGQSNMTVARALALWPQLEATGARLGSPVMAPGEANTDSWLASFMSGNGGPAPRVDFICVHWYVGFGDLGTMLDTIHATYNKPIWLTEVFHMHGTAADNAALVPTVMNVLLARPWVERVAWFALRNNVGWGGSQLVENTGVVSTAGAVYDDYPERIPLAATASVSTSRATTWRTLETVRSTTLMKGGAVGWRETYTDADLALLNVSWWYDWGNYTYDAAVLPEVGGLPFTATVTPNYVPMCWGDWEDTDWWGYGASPAASQAQRISGTMLGFNEPDEPDQANMTVARALALWPQMEATGCRLGSPAVSGIASSAIPWLSSFMSGNGGGYIPRVDFICAHWYPEYNSGYANLGDYLDYLHTTYNKPIWLTEIGTLTGGISGNEALMPSVFAALATRPWVERISWFIVREAPAWPGAYLVNSNGTLNAAGTQYASYPAGVTTTRATIWRTLAPVTTARASTWRTLTSVSTARASSWRTLAPVTTPRATTWRTLVPVAGVVTRATSWQTHSTVTTSRATTWNIAQGASTSRATSWNVAGSLVFVSTSRATSWVTRQSITTTRATTWNTLATATATRATSWRTHASVSTTRATTWNALAAVPAVTRVTSWSTGALITTARATTWNVAGMLSFVSTNRATSWITRESIATNRATTWTVCTPVAPTSRATTWNVLVTTSPTSRATSWRVHALVQTSRATSWNVAGNMYFVQTTRDTSWVTRALVNTSRTTSWATRAGITTQRVTSWRVLRTMTVSRVTTWNVASPIFSIVTSRATRWNVAPAAPSFPYLVLYPNTVMYKGDHLVKALYQGNVKIWPPSG